MTLNHQRLALKSYYLVNNIILTLEKRRRNRFYSKNKQFSPACKCLEKVPREKRKRDTFLPQFTIAHFDLGALSQTNKTARVDVG